MLGLVIGGRPCRTDFTTVSPTSLTIDIPQPATATEVCLFVLPGAALPPGSGITVLVSPPPFTDWSPLCWLHASKPSVVVRTGWADSPVFCHAPLVRLGLTLEPEAAIEALESATGPASVSAGVRGTAARLADDLEHFLGSFATVPVSLGGGMRLVLPPDVAQRWKRRVDAKTLHDANWLFRGKS